MDVTKHLRKLILVCLFVIGAISLSIAATASPTAAPTTQSPPPSLVCPEVEDGTTGICVHACSSDANCTEDLKCCSNGCGMVCVAGVPPPESEEDIPPRLIWTEVFTSERKSRVNSLPADPVEYVSNSTIITRFKFQLNNRNFLAIAGDYDDNVIFFSDAVSKQIFSGSLDDEEEGRSIYKGISPTVEGIAVDWIANNIYWCDAGYDWIMVANYEGQYSQVVVDTGLDKPRDIVIFPHKGYMYWTDWGVNSTSISMATLSGDGVEPLVTGADMHYPNGLSIDYSSEILYWVDANPSGSKVESVTLDGRNRRVIYTAVSGHSHFFDVVPFQDYLFMTDWHGNLQCINQTSGEFRFSLRLRSRPHGITTYGKDLLPAYPNSPCLSNPCQHLCVHDPDNEYKCLCGQGYVQGENRTCVEDEVALVQPSIILLSKTKLCYFPGNFADLSFPDDFEPPCILTDRPHAVALAVDINANWAFFSDFQWKRIYRVRLVPSAAVEQISGGVGSVEGMAVDYINQNLYWTDNRLNHIVVCNYDGSGRMVLLDTDVLKPRSIVIHMETRSMFWTEFGPPYEIERADLDGENRRVIVTLNYGPSGLAFDDVSGRLLFGETGTGTLYSFDLATNTLVSIHSRSRSIPFYDMEVFGDYLIWTEWGGSNGIHAINLETRNIHQSQLINEPVYGVRVFSGIKQRANATSGDCVNENGGCSQLCVATADSHRCFCTTGYQLDDDGRTCQTGALVEDNFALVTDSYVKAIFQVDLSGESHNFSAISLDGLKNPIAIDFDPVERKVYFTDVIARKISRADLSGSNMEELHTDNVFVPDGLALDYVSRLIFWSDAELNVISVSGMDGRFRRSLIKEELDQPRAIALEPFEGYIFWSDWGEQPKIEKAFMDGTNRETIVSTYITWVNGLAIDRTGNRLYWCDASTDKIESSLFDGNDRKLVIDLGSSAHPFGIGIFNDYMYWTDWTQRGLMRANKTQDGNSSSYSLIGHSDFLRLNGIVLFSEDTKLKGTTLCSTNNGGCSQLCLVTPAGKRCHCEDGSGLLDDESSCQERDSLCPSTIPNGRFPYYCDRMPGAVCSVECEDGHNAAHQNFTCLEGPRWDFPLDFICRATSCPSLNMTENVQIGECLQPYTLNSICRFDCKLGFSRTSGDVDRTCQADGTWTGEDLVCDRTTCPALEQVNGGLYQPSSCTEDVMEYDSQCRVFCGVGYVTSGPTLLTCLATGSWSVEPGSVTCIDISPPEFSEDCMSMNVTAPQGSEFYKYTGTDLGATDNSGSVDVIYNLPPPVFLEEGAHSFVQTAVDKAGNEAVCAYTVNLKVNRCPLLSIPYNSDMRSVCNNHHGATCIFRCSTGFRLVGSASLTCTETEADTFVWDNPAPHCEAVQCEIPYETDSMLPLCSPPINAGSVCPIVCRNGYQFVSGDIVIICLEDGTLDGEIPVCRQRRCPVLEEPQNGAINPEECTTTGVAAEGTCTYSCENGFQLQGAETRVCSARGEWPTMDAERECRDVNGPSFNGTCPSNMVLVAPSGKETVIARWTTPTVFDEAGHVVNVTSTLESGSVLGEGVHSVIIHAFDNSGNRMSCFFVIEVRVIRCPIHPVPGNALSSNCSRLVNSSCTFNCHDGYRLSGSQTRTCTWDGSSNEGTWSGEEPNCEAITCPPFEVTEGLHVRGCNFNVDEIPYGSTCSLFCEEGYAQVIDDIQMKCSANGTWEGESVTCTPVFCDALALKPHSSVSPKSCVNGSRPGEVCSYSCDSGFDLIGPANRTCSLHGSWDYDDQAPTCKDVTPPTFDCPANGTIILTASHCTESISVNIPPPRAFDNDGDPRVVTVADRITTVGNHTVVFIARDSVGLTANCSIDVSITAITCPELNSGLVTSLSCGNLYGSVATFQCSQYEQLIGVSNAECQQNGTWNAPLPTCQAVFCAPLEVTGSIVIANPSRCPSENVLPGTICDITCDINGASSIQVVTCRANDTTWRMIDGSLYDPVYWSSHCTDQIPPVITCPDDLQFNLTSDSPSVSATWDLPTATDNFDTSPDISGPTVPVVLGKGYHLQEYTATDKNGNTDRCIFTVAVLDVIPPMVTGCPSEKVVIQISSIMDIVTWEEPVFTDNVEITEIQSNISPGFAAGSYGIKAVVYTARDSSSNVEKCEFEIDVVQEANGCKPPDPTSNGALICTDMVICTLTCYEGYHIYQDVTSQEYECINNMWDGQMNFMTPHCRKSRRSVSRMDVIVFNSSTCAENKDAIKEKFLEIMTSSSSQSSFWTLCQLDEDMACKIDNLQVECGPDGRRKRAADNTIPSLNITYVIHATSNSSLDTFERALNLSVSAFFGPANPVINLDGGFRAEMIPEQSIQGMPLVNCSTGEEPFQLTCLTCPPGTFFKMRTQTCVKCPKGQYQNEPGQLRCISCEDGLSTPSIGTSDPKYCKDKCQPGEYSYSGLAPCLLCPLNTYQPHIGSAGCLFCPEGTSNTREGSTYASSCRAPTPEVTSTSGVDTTTLSSTRRVTTSSATTPTSRVVTTNAVADITTSKKIPTKKPADGKKGTEKPTKKPDKKNPEKKEEGKKGAQTGQRNQGSIWIWIVIGIAAMLSIIVIILLIAYISRKRQWAGHQRLYHSEEPFVGHEFENDHSMSETPHKPLQPEVSGNIVAFQNPAFAEVDL